MHRGPYRVQRIQCRSPSSSISTARRPPVADERSTMDQESAGPERPYRGLPRAGQAQTGRVVRAQEVHPGEGAEARRDALPQGRRGKALTARHPYNAPPCGRFHAVPEGSHADPGRSWNEKAITSRKSMARGPRDPRASTRWNPCWSRALTRARAAASIPPDPTVPSARRLSRQRRDRERSRRFARGARSLGHSRKGHCWFLLRPIV